MKRYCFLIILGILSVLGVNAQCITYSYHNFDINDFIIDDTLNYEMQMLAYYADGDTISNTMRFNFVGKGGRQVNQQTQVFIMKKQESMREIQSQRVAFFTNAMSLTPEEAQTFWPLYNQYNERKNKILEEQKKLVKGFTEERIAAMTKGEIEDAAGTYIKLQKQESDLIQEYHKKFMNQLPAGKVLKMYKAEKDFMQNLLWHLKSYGKDKD